MHWTHWSKGGWPVPINTKTEAFISLLLHRCLSQITSVDQLKALWLCVSAAGDVMESKVLHFLHYIYNMSLSVILVP